MLLRCPLFWFVVEVRLGVFGGARSIDMIVEGAVLVAVLVQTKTDRFSITLHQPCLDVNEVNKLQILGRRTIPKTLRRSWITRTGTDYEFQGRLRMFPRVVTETTANRRLSEKGR